MKYTVTRTAKPNGSHVHTLTNEAGEVIATRTSKGNAYTSAIIRESSTGAVTVEGWASSPALAEKAATTARNRAAKYNTTPATFLVASIQA